MDDKLDFVGRFLDKLQRRNIPTWVLYQIEKLIADAEKQGIPYTSLSRALMNEMQERDM